MYILACNEQEMLFVMQNVRPKLREVFFKKRSGDG